MSRESSAKMLQDLNKGLSDYGAHILNLQITTINIPDEVKDQRLEIWEAGRKSIAAVNDGQAKGFELPRQVRAAKVFSDGALIVLDLRRLSAL